MENEMMMDGAEDEVYTVAEIEEGWGISRKLVMRAIWAGELVPVGCGDQGWLVSLADLGKWLLLREMDEQATDRATWLDGELLTGFDAQ